MTMKPEDVSQSFEFGDLVENGWTDEANPTFRGIVVRRGHTPIGQTNSGPWVEVTDGKGKFWRHSLSGEHRLKVTGHMLDAARAAGQAEQASFQSRVQPWMLACFTPEIAADKLERNDRFIEEALELVQASSYPKERAMALVDYVYGRAEGDINQEVGGVMVTLAAHCLAHDVDMHQAGETELARILQPHIMEKIRAKQAAKPTGSALPIAAANRGTP